MKKLWIIITCLSILMPGILMAEEKVTEIAVTAQGVAYATPDIAMYRITIRHTDKRAAEATRRTAGKHHSIVAALEKGGLDPGQVSTTQFAVQPKWEYDRDRKPRKFLGYEASHTVIVRIGELERVGESVDMVVNAGATNVSNIIFAAESTDSAASAALSAAVKSARRRAEIMAEASGGRLGRLIELATGDAARARIVHVADGVAVDDPLGYSSSSATSINSAEKRVVATVYARWEFVAGKGRDSAPQG